MNRQKSALFLFLITLLPLFGCGISSLNTGEFLAVPEIASEYEQLQDEIDKALGTDGEYAAPVSGSRRQSIQLEDLDRDGTKRPLFS